MGRDNGAVGTGIVSICGAVRTASAKVEGSGRRVVAVDEACVIVREDAWSTTSEAGACERPIDEAGGRREPNGVAHAVPSSVDDGPERGDGGGDVVGEDILTSITHRESGSEGRK